MILVNQSIDPALARVSLAFRCGCWFKETLGDSSSLLVMGGFHLTSSLSLLLPSLCLFPPSPKSPGGRLILITPSLVSFRGKLLLRSLGNDERGDLRDERGDTEDVKQGARR